MSIGIKELSPNNAVGFSSIEDAAYHALNGHSYSNTRNGSILNATWEFSLFNDGCMLADGTNNCTVACQDASLAFRDVYSIHNCMSYPIISHLLTVSNLSANAVALADRYGIVATANTSAINQTLTACFNEVCGGECHSSFGTSRDIWDRYLQIEWIGPISVPNICPSIDTSIHQDIGGIGIFISYFVQIAIVLSAWIALRFFDTWTRNFISCIAYPFGPSRAKRIAVACQEKLKSSRQCVPLKAALVEFHKAQCYLMLAFQIAALTTLKAGFQVLQFTSYLQLNINVALISDISVGGFLPVTFVLFCLHSEGMRSWYIFALSVCTVSVSVITFFAVSNFAAHKTDVRDLSTNLKSCGRNPNPIYYCTGNSPHHFHYLTSMDNGCGSGSMLLHSLVVLVLLFIDQCKPFHQKGSDSKGKRINAYVYLKVWIKSWPFWHRTESQAFLKWIWLDTAERAVRFGTAALLLTIELYYFVLLSVLFSSLFYIYVQQPKRSETGWGFGQIIAVTIWAPYLVEYVYLSLRGMIGGLHYRIPEPYHVVKDAGYLP